MTFQKIYDVHDEGDVRQAGDPERPVHKSSQQRGYVEMTRGQTDVDESVELYVEMGFARRHSSSNNGEELGEEWKPSAMLANCKKGETRDVAKSMIADVFGGLVWSILFGHIVRM